MWKTQCEYNIYGFPNGSLLICIIFIFCFFLKEKHVHRILYPFIYITSVEQVQEILAIEEV